MNNRIFTVTEINSYIKYLMENDVLLSSIYVRGEISNLKLHTSGHIYFTLKDRESRIKCVMFKGHSSKLKFVPEDGFQVIVRGYFSIYERDGQYQLYAEDMVPEGTGSLYKAYEQLKKRLSDEGLFAAETKRKLPFLPKCVGVVTSPTGAAIRDIISIIRRRCPIADILLYPVQVQGAGAELEVAEGIRYFSRAGNAEVVIVGRGGGSIEELWAFNEEVVARAIHASPVPVISAVGHETDFTIADFAADVRAATPSAAAELAVPDLKALLGRLEKDSYLLNSAMSNFIKARKLKVEKISGDSVFRQVERRLLGYRQTVDMLEKYLDNNMSHILKDHRNSLEKSLTKLELLNPESALYRGYALIRKSRDKSLVLSARTLAPGDEIEINLKDGVASAVVKEIK